ncbi:MAG: phosphoglycerate kinase [Hyphomicrobiales bacterium]
MKNGYRTLDGVDGSELKGKRVLLRVDLNVPVDSGRVADATRIKRVLPTISELTGKGARVILLSHMGRPKGVPDGKNSLKPVHAWLEANFGATGFAADCVGDAAKAAVGALAPGGVLLLENTRFHKGEEKNDPAFVSELAALGDIYVNDAFSCAHRAHASTEGLAHHLPSYAGRSMQAELDALASALEAPKRPLAAVVGGAKISTKLDLLGNLLARVDILIIGGAMANTFLAAQGHAVGKSLMEPDLLGTARGILDKAAALGREIVLPVDVVLAKAFEAGAPCREAAAGDAGADEMILDIGPRTAEYIISCLRRSRTLVWNGPFGAFELKPFDNGTNTVARAAAELTKRGRLLTVAGGGDTVAALNAAGVADGFSYVSTAGGAFLEWLEGKSLPGLEVLRA